jgi:hypothetical protein
MVFFPASAATTADVVTPMQIRQARADLTAYTMDLSKRTIPASAILHDFRAGPGHEGLAPNSPDVASFRYDGELYFNMTHEIIDKTVIVSVSST